MKQPEDNKTTDMFDASISRAKVVEGLDDRISKYVKEHARYVNSFFLVAPWRDNKQWSSKALTKVISEKEKKALIKKHLVMTTNKIKGQFK